MAFIPTDAKMEAIEKLRSQIDELLQKLDLQREEGGELRNKLIKSEAENRVKDEYIRSLEQRLNALQGESALKNLDAKG